MKSFYTNQFDDEVLAAFGGGGGSSSGSRGSSGGSSSFRLSSPSTSGTGLRVSQSTSNSFASNVGSSISSPSRSTASSSFSLSSPSTSGTGLRVSQSTSNSFASNVGSSISSPSWSTASSSFSLSSPSTSGTGLRVSQATASTFATGSGLRLSNASNTANAWGGTVGNALDVGKGLFHTAALVPLSQGSAAAAATLTRGAAVNLPGRADYALTLRGAAPVNTSSLSGLFGSLDQRLALQTPTGLQNYQLSNFSPAAKSSQQIVSAANTAKPLYTAGSWLGHAGTGLTFGLGAFEGYANSARSGMGRAIDTVAGAIKQGDNLAAQALVGAGAGLLAASNPISLPAAPYAMAGGAIGAGAAWGGSSWDRAFNNVVNAGANLLHGWAGTSGQSSGTGLNPNGASGTGLKPGGSSSFTSTHSSPQVFRGAPVLAPTTRAQTFMMR